MTKPSRPESEEARAAHIDDREATGSRERRAAPPTGGQGWSLPAHVELPQGRLEQVLADKAPLYSQADARAEADRCLYCFDAPCIQACPTAIDVPKFIKRIASGDILGSARTILESNLLGYSCGRVCPVEVLCVGACVYNHLEQPPIQIGRLQRYAVETAWASGRPVLSSIPIRVGAAGGRGGSAGGGKGSAGGGKVSAGGGKGSAGKVALVGAGPASLSCAGVLALAGVEAVIYESRPWPGGLNTTGVAPYKMPASDSLMEVEFIRSLGVRIETGVTIGVDIDVAHLLDEYDAVFLGLGLGSDRRLDIPGEDGEGVIGAVGLIERLKLDPDAGNVLRPLASSALESGHSAHERVRMDSRDNPAIHDAWSNHPDNSMLEGARTDNHGPSASEIVRAKDPNDSAPEMRMDYRMTLGGGDRGFGNVLVVGGGNTAIDAARELAQLGAASVSLVYRRSASEMSGYAHELDAARSEGVRVIDRATPQEVIRKNGRVVGLRVMRTQSVDLPADLIVVAIGQDRLAATAASFPGVEVDAEGRIVIDANGRTGNPKVYAGGDCTNGGKEVVNAVADGKLAAASILERLQILR